MEAARAEIQRCCGTQFDPEVVAVFQQMPDDMDFDAGVVLRGVSIEDAGRALFEKMIAVASGEKTKSEIHGMGDEEFNPWIQGPTL